MSQALPDLKCYSLRSGGPVEDNSYIMTSVSTAISVPTASNAETEEVLTTDPVDVGSGLVTIDGSAINEEELDAALAEEQERMETLARQQRLLSKKQNLERIRAECQKLTLQNQQLNQPPLSLTREESIAATGLYQLANGGPPRPPTSHMVTVSSVGGPIPSPEVATAASLRRLQRVQNSVDDIMAENGLLKATGA